MNDLVGASRGEGVFKSNGQIQKVALLILDEWLLVPLTINEARDLLEIVEARHKKASYNLSSQFAPPGGIANWRRKRWPMQSLIEINHDSYTILIDGEESMRKRKGIKE